MVSGKYFEMVLLSRGGMGIKSVANWLALAEWQCVYLEEGERGYQPEIICPQAFPEYGPERSGAPMKAFVRFGLKGGKVRLHCEIYESDLTFLDHSVLRGGELLGLVEKQKLPKKDGILVSNYPTGPEEFLGYFNSRLWEVGKQEGVGLDYRFTGKVYSVDAKEIADDLKIDFQNTAMLGCIVRALEEEDVITLPIEIVKSVVKEGFKGKPEKIIKPNLEAIDTGYERVSCYRTNAPE